MKQYLKTTNEWKKTKMYIKQFKVTPRLKMTMRERAATHTNIQSN